MTPQPFLVGPTTAEVRSRYPGEYVICVNPTVKRQLGIGSDAAVEHERSVGTGSEATTLALAGLLTSNGAIKFAPTATAISTMVTTVAMIAKGE